MNSRQYKMTSWKNSTWSLRIQKKTNLYIQIFISNMWVWGILKITLALLCIRCRKLDTFVWVWSPKFRVLYYNYGLFFLTLTLCMKVKENHWFVSLSVFQQSSCMYNGDNYYIIAVWFDREAYRKRISRTDRTLWYVRLCCTVIVSLL